MGNIGTVRIDNQYLKDRKAENTQNSQRIVLEDININPGSEVIGQAHFQVCVLVSHHDSISQFMAHHSVPSRISLLEESFQNRNTGKKMIK